MNPADVANDIRRLYLASRSIETVHAELPGVDIHPHDTGFSINISLDGAEIFCWTIWYSGRYEFNNKGKGQMVAGEAISTYLSALARKAMVAAMKLESEQAERLSKREQAKTEGSRALAERLAESARVATEKLIAEVAA